MMMEGEQDNVGTPNSQQHLHIIARLENTQLAEHTPSLITWHPELSGSFKRESVVELYESKCTRTN